MLLPRGSKSDHRKAGAKGGAARSCFCRATTDLSRKRRSRRITRGRRGCSVVWDSASQVSEGGAASYAPRPGPGPEAYVSAMTALFGAAHWRTDKARKAATTRLTSTVLELSLSNAATLTTIESNMVAALEHLAACAIPLDPEALIESVVSRAQPDGLRTKAAAFDAITAIVGGVCAEDPNSVAARAMLALLVGSGLTRRQMTEALDAAAARVAEDADAAGANAPLAPPNAAQLAAIIGEAAGSRQRVRFEFGVIARECVRREMMSTQIQIQIQIQNILVTQVKPTQTVMRMMAHRRTAPTRMIRGCCCGPPGSWTQAGTLSGTNLFFPVHRCRFVRRRLLCPARLFSPVSVAADFIEQARNATVSTNTNVYKYKCKYKYKIYL